MNIHTSSTEESADQKKLLLWIISRATVNQAKAKPLKESSPVCTYNTEGKRWVPKDHDLGMQPLPFQPFITLPACTVFIQHNPSSVTQRAVCVLSEISAHEMLNSGLHQD